MKKILIGIPFLNSGGVEVALIRFLKELVKKKDLKIELLLLKKEGIYLEEVPHDIKIEEVSYDDSIYDYNLKLKDIKNIPLKKKYAFLKFRFKLKKALQKNDYQTYYQLFLKHVILPEKTYDLAIDYHGYGHFMSSIIASVKASKKVMWIHDERNTWLSKVSFWLPNFQKFFCVSTSAFDNVLLNQPSLQGKVEIFYNLSDYKNVIKKSSEKVTLKFSKDCLNIITVARLEYQKGYDIAIKCAKILKDKGVNFCWYAIGGGSLKEELVNLVKENDLEANFKFLGVIPNPYPYVKMADLYVLTSRHEGYSLAILEAKILGKVIVVTDIKSNQEQITSGQNGLLCKLTPNDFASKIIEISQNKELQQKFQQNLAKEDFDFTKEFQKLDKLLEKN